MCLGSMQTGRGELRGLVAKNKIGFKTAQIWSKCYTSRIACSSFVTNHTTHAPPTTSSSPITPPPIANRGYGAHDGDVQEGACACVSVTSPPMRVSAHHLQHRQQSHPPPSHHPSHMHHPPPGHHPSHSHTHHLIITHHTTCY